MFRRVCGRWSISVLPQLASLYAMLKSLRVGETSVNAGWRTNLRRRGLRRPFYLGFEFDGAVPMIVRFAFRTTFLFPQHVGALAKMLVAGAGPKLFVSAFRAALFQP